MRDPECRVICGPEVVRGPEYRVMRGPGNRVLGCGARWPGVLGPGRRCKDSRGPGRLPDPARRWVVRERAAWTVMLWWRQRWWWWWRWPSGGHVQVPPGVQQRPDAQRSSSCHETVHAVAGHDGRARVHELEHALHVLVTDALQDDSDAVVRAGMAEEQRLRTTTRTVQITTRGRRRARLGNTERSAPANHMAHRGGFPVDHIIRFSSRSLTRSHAHSLARSLTLSLTLPLA